MQDNFQSLFERHSDGHLTLVKGLTPEWVETIRDVLRQQSDRDTDAFDRSLDAFLSKGYRVTSLVAHLSYPPTGSTLNSQRLSCELRVKIGAKPAPVVNGKQPR